MATDQLPPIQETIEEAREQRREWQQRYESLLQVVGERDQELRQLRQQLKNAAPNVEQRLVQQQRDIETLQRNVARLYRDFGPVEQAVTAFSRLVAVFSSTTGTKDFD